MSELSSLRAWVLLAVGLAAAAPATAGDVALELNADVVSRYVFRGVVLDDGWSFQPEVVLDVGLGDATRLEVGAWWNLALESKGSSSHRDEVFEVDLTVALSHALSDTVTVWLGPTYYWLPRSDVEAGSEEWSTTEVAAGVEWAEEPVVVEAVLVYDLDRYEGWYLDLATEAELALGGPWALVPRLHLGLASDLDPDPTDPDQEHYYEKNALVDGELALGLSWSPSGVFSVGVAGHYTHRFDGVDEDESFAWVGVRVSYTP